MGNAILSQPIVKDSVFWNAKALTPAGVPVAIGTEVFLDFILLDQNDTVPVQLSKAYHDNAFTELYTLLEIFDLFDEAVATLDTLFPCNDYVCTVIQPVWDQTDPTGSKVSPGLYYYISSTFDAYTAERKSKIGPAWITVPGTIGTTDAAGDFKIPPLPQDEKRVTDISGTAMAKYYKGWIRLTFTHTGPSGTDTLGKDTLNIFGPRRNLVLHPH